MPPSVQRINEIALYFEKHGRDSTLENYNIGYESLTRYLRLYKNKDKVDVEEESKAEYTEEGVNSCGTANRKNRPYSIEEMAQLFKVDTSVWQVKRHTTNSWDVTNKHGVTYKNYQTKVWWERSETLEDLDYIKDNMFNELARLSPKVNAIKRGKSTGNLLEINIRDLHLGKLAWSPETGENYDMKIARERFHQVLTDLLRKASVFGFDNVVFCASDDFFHTDTLEDTTAKGTLQHTEGRYQKMFDIGTQMFYDAITEILDHSPVEVVMVPGNHDKQRSFFLGEVLRARYHNHGDVTILNSPKIRKYQEHGVCMIGFTHGEGVKVQDLPLIMAQEEPEMWGRTKIREVHIAHRHSKKAVKWISTQDYKGVVVRQMTSPSATDQWHYEKGFIGSIKGAEAFLWNKDTGLSASFDSNIIIERD